MGKLSLLFVLLLGLSASVAAQTRYYNESKTFKEDGYTYQCDVMEKIGWVKLYNAEEKWVAAPVTKKGSSEPFVMLVEDYEPLTTAGKNAKAFSAAIAPCKKVATDILNAYKTRLESDNLDITMGINPDTGKVEGVYFEFVNMSGYGTLPVSVYRQIEKGLIGKQFTPTALGKTLSYIPCRIGIRFK